MSKLLRWSRACGNAGLASLLFVSMWNQSMWSQQQKKEAKAEVNEKKGGVEAAVPASAGVPVDPKTFKLGPEDVLGITVWREPDLSRAVMVRPDGKISLPLVGELPAAGRTPLELTTDVTEALSKLMNRPEVFISVQQVNSRKYYMTGEIRRSGVFPLVTPITILEALGIAGGPSELANTSKITIIRGKERLKFNYKEVLKGKNLQQNILLENGDHIFVP